MDITSTIGAGVAVKKKEIRAGRVKSSPWLRVCAFVKKKEKTIWGIVLVQGGREREHSDGNTCPNGYGKRKERKSKGETGQQGGRSCSGIGMLRVER